jgi:lipopolysaccharide assembly outer membrane protein LptD (OstA)
MRFSTKITLLLGLWAISSAGWAQNTGAKLAGPVEWGTESDRGQTQMDPKNRTVELTNGAWVKYTGLELRAGVILIDFKNNLLTAFGLPDSSGKTRQYPVFKEGTRTLYADTIRYNLASGKGWIKSAATQEGGGYLQGGKAKMISDSSYFLANNTFSTCNHEVPHFAIVTQKAKLDVGKRIVTGPAYLEIAGIPTPLALPFAYLHARSGGVAGYVFIGVMIGISFFLLNNMFGFIGNLRQWTPWFAAGLPSLLYSVLSLSAFGWLVLRR